MKLSRSKSSIRIRSTSRHLTQSNSGLLKIDSLPNLRVLCQRISNETSPESSAILKTAAIYRSSKPDKIVEKDVVKFRQLSIKSIVDFRSKEEYLLTKDHNLIDAEYTLYKVCLPNNNYQPALKLISEPDNLPVLINCAYGKDRTGIISALILTCLGMPKSYVAAEYALSTEGLEPVRQLVYQDIVGKYELTEEFCNSETETMLKLLNYIEEKYTSVEGYMCHIGFSLEEQHRLKANVEAFRHLGYEDDNDDDDHKVTGVVSSKSETLSSHPKSD
ncbi:uncharacterized protein LOC106073282 isoform X2 [Biomphalaria glabrata]|uniref:Uncharacterized protein LOC106073282 isoform X2 n=1 Tax=Biomphalaria glabrata TaxID=6526 RepID=A0A9W2YHI4_BIOGL|nr:uncharacterized protein LOC106073282 isoform X2 [Biomphalaria glabrata]